VTEPRAHLGTFYEIDVSTYDEDGDTEPRSSLGDSSNGGVATATAAPPEPTLTIHGDIPDQYAYEVLVYDVERDRHLVAAVEIVSPANKDRPDSRQIFVAKCASLLAKGVCVSIVDPVTIRRFNLYTELLTLNGYSDPAFTHNPADIYAVTCRKRTAGRDPLIETWAYPLAIGQSLPSLPIWLTETAAVTLDLETSYEETCRALRIA
jgi:hypothetical protein